MIDPDALRVLELDRMNAWTATYTRSRVGWRAAEHARPAVDLDAARTLLRETAEAVVLSDAGRIPNLELKDDVMPLLVSAREQGIPLLARELAALFRFSRRARRLREFLLDLDPESSLRALGRAMPDLSALCGELEDSIDELGSLLDTATAKLRALRKEIAERREMVRRALERFARRPDVRGLVRSMHPAIRDGRYVLAVRSGARGQVRGLYHDRSATGQTAYVEPEIVVADQNRVRDLEIDEEREVNRILFRLTRLALEQEAAIESTASLVARVDLACARAAVARALGFVEPELTPDGPLVLRDARHPLLLALAFDRANEVEESEPTLTASSATPPATSPTTQRRSDAEIARRREVALASVVPFTLSLGDSYDLLVLTGPNTGGKTATLKALGLCSLLARCGHFVPAAPTPRVPFHAGVFADIGDDQDLAQNLSTFSAHVRRAGRILSTAPRGSLVLLDELGSGTDPLEGEALATALLADLLARGHFAVVTTHLGRLKEFAGREPRAANASMQFDPDTLRPTYRLLLGVPGASNALRIARNLGLPAAIVDRAEELLESGGDRTSALFLELDRSRVELERLRDLAERDRNEAATKRAAVDRDREANDLAEAALLLNAEEAAEARLRAFADEIEGPRRQLLATGGASAKVAGAILDALRRMLAASPLNEHRKRFLKSLRPGDPVKLIKMNEVGRVKRVLKKSDRVEVEVRRLAVTVGVDDIAPAPRGE